METEPLAVLMMKNDSSVGGATFVRYLWSPKEANPKHYNTVTTGLFVMSVEEHNQWHDRNIMPFYKQT